MNHKLLLTITFLLYLSFNNSLIGQNSQIVVIGANDLDNLTVSPNSYIPERDIILRFSYSKSNLRKKQFKSATVTINGVEVGLVKRRRTGTDYVIPASITQNAMNIAINIKGINRTLPDVNPSAAVTTCEDRRNWANNFGEQVEHYGRNSITYLYDFNKDINKEEVYKIYKSKRTGFLIMEPANFSSEVLTPFNDVKFKVINLNRYLYDVNFADSIVQFKSEQSDLFKDAFIGQSSGLLGRLLNSIATTNGIMSVSPIDKAEFNLESFIVAVRDYLNTYNKLRVEYIKRYSDCSCFDNCNEVSKKYQDLLDYKASVELITGAVKADSAETKASFDEIVVATQRKLSTKTALEQELKTIKAKDKLSKKEQARMADLESIIKSIDEEIEENELSQVNLTAQLVLYNEALKLKRALPSDADEQKLLISLQNVIDRAQTFSSGAIQVDGNQLNLQLTIQSNTTVVSAYGLAPMAPRTLDYKIPVKFHGFGSFGSGVFISPDRNLQNFEYKWQEVANSNNVVTDTAGFRLAQSGYSAPAFGFAAYGHIQWMFGRSWGLGLSPGVGLTIEKQPRIAYLLGASFIFGRENQVVFTVGYAAMHVNKLENNLKYAYEHDITYTTKPSDPTYTKELKAGLFLSVSYTIFNPLKTPKSED